jgi:hypothetical protein
MEVKNNLTWPPMHNDDVRRGPSHVGRYAVVAVAHLRRFAADYSEVRCSVTTITAAAQCRCECDQPISAVHKESLC